jgi:DNA-binding response OmpR family regulator
MKRVYSILLAEDDDNSAKVVIHTLDKYNFDVSHANDGMAALSRVKTNSYDLIISDLMMPYLDGFAFLEKGSEYIKDTPTIILTAAGERKNVLKAAQQHVNHYLLKPIDFESLIEKVLQCLKIKKEDLIDKKSIPLRISLSEEEENTVRLELNGCPKKNSSDEISQRCFDYLSTHSTIQKMDIYIDENFFVEASRFRILDELVLKLIRNTKIRASYIKIIAEEISHYLPDKDKFPNLMSCKIESRA